MCSTKEKRERKETKVVRADGCGSVGSFTATDGAKEDG